jgi:hypothetical protein
MSLPVKLVFYGLVLFLAACGSDGGPPNPSNPTPQSSSLDVTFSSSRSSLAPSSGSSAMSSRMTSSSSLATSSLGSSSSATVTKIPASAVRWLFPSPYTNIADASTDRIHLRLGFVAAYSDAVAQVTVDDQALAQQGAEWQGDIRLKANGLVHNLRVLTKTGDLTEIPFNLDNQDDFAAGKGAVAAKAETLDVYNHQLIFADPSQSTLGKMDLQTGHYWPSAACVDCTSGRSKYIHFVGLNKAQLVTAARASAVNSSSGYQTLRWDLQTNQLAAPEVLSAQTPSATLNSLVAMTLREQTLYLLDGGVPNLPIKRHALTLTSSNRYPALGLEPISAVLNGAELTADLAPKALAYNPEQNLFWILREQAGIDFGGDALLGLDENGTLKTLVEFDSPAKALAAGEAGTAYVATSDGIVTRIYTVKAGVNGNYTPEVLSAVGSFANQTKGRGYRFEQVGIVNMAYSRTQKVLVVSLSDGTLMQVDTQSGDRVLLLGKTPRVAVAGDESGFLESEFIPPSPSSRSSVASPSSPSSQGSSGQSASAQSSSAESSLGQGSSGGSSSGNGSSGNGSSGQSAASESSSSEPSVTAEFIYPPQGGNLGGVTETAMRVKLIPLADEQILSVRMGDQLLSQELGLWQLEQLVVQLGDMNKMLTVETTTGMKTFNLRLRNQLGGLTQNQQLFTSRSLLLVPPYLYISDPYQSAVFRRHLHSTAETQVYKAPTLPLSERYNENQHWPLAYSAAENSLYVLEDRWLADPFVTAQGVTLNQSVEWIKHDLSTGGRQVIASNREKLPNQVSTGRTYYSARGLWLDVERRFNADTSRLYGYFLDYENGSQALIRVDTVAGYRNPNFVFSPASSTTEGRKADSVNVDNHPLAMAVNPVTQTFYVMKEFLEPGSVSTVNPTLVAFNPATEEQSAVMIFGNSPEPVHKPTAMVLDRDQTGLYLIDTGRVWHFNLTTKAITLVSSSNAIPSEKGQGPAISNTVWSASLDTTGTVLYLAMDTQGILAVDLSTGDRAVLRR